MRRDEFRFEIERLAKYENVTIDQYLKKYFPEFDGNPEQFIKTLHQRLVFCGIAEKAFLVGKLSIPRFIKVLGYSELGNGMSRLVGENGAVCIGRSKNIYDGYYYNDRYPSWPDLECEALFLPKTDGMRGIRFVNVDVTDTIVYLTRSQINFAFENQLNEGLKQLRASAQKNTWLLWVSFPWQSRCYTEADLLYEENRHDILIGNVSLFNKITLSIEVTDIVKSRIIGNIYSPQSWQLDLLMMNKSNNTRIKSFINIIDRFRYHCSLKLLPEERLSNYIKMAWNIQHLPNYHYNVL